MLEHTLSSLVILAASIRVQRTDKQTRKRYSTPYLGRLPLAMRW